MKKSIYIIWIGWIWISAIARYYLSLNYSVYWSDSTNSELIEALKKEWCDIIIWKDKNRITDKFEKVVYTEAVKKSQEEIIKSIELKLEIQTYPEALAEIVNDKKLIAISWTHWKSTTTSITSILLKNTKNSVNSIVWTILKEFWNKNSFFSDSDYFVIEACEYKRSFLNYNPFIWVITNIDLDHLDYYKDLEDYISAFDEFINNINVWWFAILNWNCSNSKTLLFKRKDINYIEINKTHVVFTNTNQESEVIPFPKINLQVPWEHILFDAQIAYIIWFMLWIEDEQSIKSLESYSWVWRRMEIIWNLENDNILMSDYWHHPTEIRLTLKALKDKSPARPILTVFQPHQYSRTLELIEDFKNCFFDTDKLIVPNIYESRDTKEDKEKINSSIFIDKIKHDNKVDWENFEKTILLIDNWVKENNYWTVILMWAWDIDNLRKKIKTV